MARWTRLDQFLIGIAVFLTLALMAHRTYQYWQIDRSAEQVYQNILHVSGAVHAMHRNKQRWFPLPEPNVDTTRIYNNPFEAHAPQFQGLDLPRLNAEANHGLVLQLVRYDESLDQQVYRHLFTQPFLDHEPYLRILIDYGERAALESSILKQVQHLLPTDALAEIDDHMFIVDLRRLANDE